MCGSRRYDDRNRIAKRLFDLPPPYDDLIIVHGNARGVDRIAGQEAEKLGFRVEKFPADWDQFGKRAGYVRNLQMAQAGANLCIAFWDGTSKGTKHMMDIAEEHGIPVEIIPV